MQVLSTNEYKLFQQLARLNQTDMMKTMYKFLDKKYKKVILTKDYLIAEGSIPVALVAHADTVFKDAPAQIFYDQRKNVIWSPQGLGADDRAGIFGIIKLIRKGYRPHIIITTDEEIGAFGARALTQTFSEPFGDMKYIIQLDRRGTSDCVFYDCDNKDFVKYVEGFGFTEAIGSFSDISIICPKWKIAGVNLSIGYIGEHTTSELFYVNPFLATVEKVAKMLNDINNVKKPFEYIPSRYGGYDNSSLSSLFPEWFAEETYTRCCDCQKIFSDYEIFPVKGLDGLTKFYCSDCVVKAADWCTICGEPYEVEDEHYSTAVCQDCRNRLEGKK